ncbi:unnamed protein product [Kuraishia capsulata CBS 1993]|uniref:DNA mismatch repair protein MSH3 n=1 Tax=Kuraishia capsulata CBS 1993 TaxID=1382522 RepID=W6ML34_9ASCO|nr:uncharacterized protein KUCA_T00003156001 [Kuraishia capsulata CBS 1993]CDK27179.1 unnamed protein product [Kuraishia capsulata CBS 1993]
MPQPIISQFFLPHARSQQMSAESEVFSDDDLMEISEKVPEPPGESSGGLSGDPSAEPPAEPPAPQRQPNPLKKKPSKAVSDYSYAPISAPKTTGSKKPDPKPKRVRETPDDDRTVKKPDIAASVKLTPLEQQFVELKSNNPESVLAIRVGYKYKFFGEDARVVAGLLDIMLLDGKFSIDLKNPPPRDKMHSRYAYCSIPDNRLHIHLKRLLGAGLKVGVVEQTETAALKSNSANKSKIFERDISRVYTAATYIDDNEAGESILSLDRGGGYILAVSESDGLISVVGVHLLSGEIVYDTFADGAMHSEFETRLFHLYPVEIMVVGEISHLTSRTLDGFKSHVYKHDNATTLRVLSREREVTGIYYDEFTRLLENSPSTLDLFLNQLTADVQQCCAQLAVYLKEFGLASVFEVSSNYNKFADLNRRMILDANTLQNLEIFRNYTNGKEVGSLLYLLDHTRTKFGGRLLRKWLYQPLMNYEDIAGRSASVDDILNGDNRRIFERLGGFLHSTPDLEKGLAKIHYKRTKRKETYILVRQFVELIGLFCNFETLTEQNFRSKHLYDLLMTTQHICKDELGGFKDLLNMIRSDAAMDEADLDQQRAQFFKYDYFESLKSGDIEVKEVEKELETELVQIKTFLKRPAMTYDCHANDPYLVSVRNTQVKSLPSDWVKISGTKSVSRFKTPEMVRLQKQLQYKQGLLLQECDRCYLEFLEKIDQSFILLKRLVNTLAELDCLFSLAAVAIGNSDYTRPTFVHKQVISLRKSRNPVAEVVHSSKHYIANDVEMSEEDSRILIVTGPNMGGKSSFIKQIALTVIMAQMGSFVPAETATLGVFDSVFIRMGAQDEIMKGKSTFEVELSECSTILRQCTDKSLVLLDEVGRGTSATDGLAIAHSILDFLITTEGKRPFTLFITHFPALESFEDSHGPVVKNVHMGYRLEKSSGSDVEDLVFLYKLARGVCRESYGLNAARLANIDERILKRGLEISSRMRADHSLGWGLNVGTGLKNALDDPRAIHTLLRRLS